MKNGYYSLQTEIIKRVNKVGMTMFCDLQHCASCHYLCYVITASVHLLLKIHLNKGILSN